MLKFSPLFKQVFAIACCEFIWVLLIIWFLVQFLFGQFQLNENLQIRQSFDNFEWHYVCLGNHQFYGISRWKQSTFDGSIELRGIIFGRITWKYWRFHWQLHDCADKPIHWRQAHNSLSWPAIDSMKTICKKTWKFTIVSLDFIDYRLVRYSSSGHKMFTICMCHDC